MVRFEISFMALGAALAATGAAGQSAPDSASHRPQLPVAADRPAASQQPPVTTGAVTTTAAQVEGNAPTNAQAGGIGEIIVTAQRRSENLQRVPISVAAVTQERLQAAGVTSLDSIQALVPGVVVAKTFAGTTPFVRGVGTIHTGFTSEVPVAVYIDGVYLPNSASSVFAFNNIERVEVLKGPQGTLFGRNAVGGLINIVTRDPSQTPAAEGSVGYGNYDTYDASLYATTGLGSTVAIDFAALFHDQRDGWGRNLLTGDDLFKNRETSFSSKLKWTPTDTTTVTLRGLYDHSNGDIGTAFAVYPGSVGTDGTRYVSEYDARIRRAPFNVSTQENVGLKVEQDLDFARLISLSGYNHLHSNFLGDSNAIVGNLTPGQGVNNLQNNGRSTTFTEELQLQSQKVSALQWIVGGFYMHDHFILNSDITPTCIGAVCNAAPTPIRSVGNQILNSYAAFGEATLTVAEKMHITLGLRYTSDHKDESGAYRQPIAGYPTSVAKLPAPNFFGDVGAVDPKATFSKLTWRGVVAYDLTASVMGYVSYNRGFKAGAFNPTSFANPVVKPEVLDAYEAGVKSELFDRMLRLNVSGFYYNYNNIQLRTLAPPAPPGQSILYNAAKAHIKGIDADAVLAPTRYLTINGSFEVLDAKFASFPGGVCTAPRVIAGAVLGGATSAACDLTGNRLQKAPKFTGTIGATYRIPSAIGEFALNGSDTYNSGYFWDSDNRLRQKAYQQVNVSLTWTSPNQHFNAQLYAHNLNKPYYFLAVTEASGGTDDYTPGDPRTYGIKLGFKF